MTGRSLFVVDPKPNAQKEMMVHSQNELEPRFANAPLPLIYPAMAGHVLQYIFEQKVQE